MTEDKRQFSRVSFQTTARLSDTSGNPLARGDVKNLSMAGMLVVSDAKLAPGTQVRASIHLEGGSEPLDIIVGGRIVRESEGRLGVQFVMDGVSLESVTHLRRLVSINLGDDDAVIDEVVRNSLPPPR